jgi:hypothetical protein
VVVGTAAAHTCAHAHTQHALQAPGAIDDDVDAIREDTEPPAPGQEENEGWKEEENGARAVSTADGAASHGRRPLELRRTGPWGRRSPADAEEQEKPFDVIGGDPSLPKQTHTLKVRTAVMLSLLRTVRRCVMGLDSERSASITALLPLPLLDAPTGLSKGWSRSAILWRQCYARR